MAFNFMAALGGFGRQVSENIESQKEFERQKEFKLEMLAAEEATKMRLARAQERKQQRAKDKETAGRLKAMGFGDDRIAFALAQGTGYADGLADIASVALNNGKDPNTLLTYSSDMDQFRQLSGSMEAGRTRVGEVDPSRIPEGFDYSTAFTQDRDLTISLMTEKKEDRIFKSNEELLAWNTQQILGVFGNDGTVKDMDKYKNLLNDRGKIIEAIAYSARAKDTSDDPAPVDMVSQNQYNQDMKISRSGVAGKYNLVTLEGEFQKQEEGGQAVSVIAEIDANLRTGMIYDALEGENILKQQGTTRVNAAIESSVASLGVLALQVYQEWDKKQNGKQFDGGLASKWKMPEGQNNFNLQKMFKDAKAGNITDLMNFQKHVDSLRWGDVIQVDGHFATYTGFTQTYDQIKDHNGNALAMPILFVGNSIGQSNYIYSNISNK